MKYDYKPKEGSAHDGFVMEDPEGYLLEFERFNPHEENLQFTPLLDSLETISAAGRDGVLTPAGRRLRGTLTAVNPAYTHGFGEPLPELSAIGGEVRAMLRERGLIK